MKTMKNFILSTALLAIFSVEVFAASGFEAILNVPIGMGVGMPSKNEKESDTKSGIGFDIGVTAQLGYMLQVKQGFGISLLGEIGYSHDTYATTWKDGDNYLKTQQIYESFQIGLLPKFNIGAGPGTFSIGIGGGVKIPLAITYKYDSKFGDNTSKDKEKIKMNEWKKSYVPVIGYIKASFDYSIFLADQHAINVGLYLGYDIMPNYNSKTVKDIKEYNSDFKKSDNQSGSFDVGVQIGYRFGPKTI